MKRILSSSAVLAAVLAAFPALAERVDAPPRIASVAIGAPADYVVAARTLQLTARTQNNRGAIVRGRAIDWQVSDATRASIDGNGVLSGIAPGPVDVTATDSDASVSGVRTFYIYPASVTVSSDSNTVQAGGSLKLAAQALDADGKTIPNMPFQWFTDLPAVAKVTSNGVLTAVAEGRVTITASLDMGPAYSRFTAFASVEVTRKADYKLRTLLTSNTTSSGVTTLVPAKASVAGNSAAAVVSLSNGGQAIVVSQSGRVQTIFSTGSTLDGQVVVRFDGISVNAQGDVLALAEGQAEWCDQILVLFQASAKWAPKILDDTTRCSYWWPPTGSLGKTGALAYQYNNVLYLRKPDGTVQKVLAQQDHPTPSTTINNISNWSVASSGRVLIEAQNSAGVSNYYMWDGTKLTRLFGVGDQVVNLSSSWANLPVEVNPGEYIVRIGGSNWASLSRLKDGVWSTIALNGQNGIGWVQNAYDAADGNIFFFADTNGGSAVWRYDGTSTTNIALYPDWRHVTQLSAAGGDGVLVYGTAGGPVPQIVRLSGTLSSVVLGPGRAVDGTPAPAIGQSSVLKGINGSSPIVRSGDSLFKVTAGVATTILKPTDPLPNGSLAWLGSVTANRLGDVAFTAQHGAKVALYAYRNGQIQLIADSDDTLSGGQIWGFATWADNQLAINNVGHIAASVNTSAGNGIYLFTGTSAASGRNVARIGGIAPGSTSSFTGIGPIAIDDNDRVIFQAGLSNGKNGAFIWDKGTLKEIVESGQQDAAGKTYNYINNVQAAGTKFYLRVGYSNSNGQLVSDGSATTVLAADGSATTFGTVMSGLFGAEITANSRGDAVFPVVTPSGTALVMRGSDGKDHLVAISSVKGPDGEWFLSIFGAGVSEQGDVIFSALGWLNGAPRLAIYQATPAF
jgi:Bacterial Ig-like domain (group 2)